MRPSFLTMEMLQKSNDVLFETLNKAGVITLNRPKNLNALTQTMFSNMIIKLREWEKNKNLVIIKGAGKAFSAGGDVKILSQSLTEAEQYDIGIVAFNIFNTIANYKIPYVAIMDGVAMGAGLAIAKHGTYRIATENTVVAMPEIKIGSVPDCGGTYFLPRLASHLGFYLGLTGKTLTGKDVTAVGLATHFVPSHKLMEMEDELSYCDRYRDVNARINKYHEPVQEVFSLSPYMKEIEYCFSAKKAEDIISRLSLINNDWSADNIKAMRLACPLSLKLALKSLHLGAQLNLQDCQQMEYRIMSRLADGHNLKEGVRANLVAKDESPQWIPKNLEDVNECDLEPYFERLPNDLIMINPKTYYS